MRTLVALTLSLLSSAALANNDLVIAGNWAYTLSASKVDDSPQITAVDLADGTATTAELAARNRNDPTTLVVGCVEHKTALVVLTTSGFWGLDLPDTKQQVIYRVNKDPAVIGYWSLSPGGTGVVYPPSPISFLRSLPSTGSLYVRVYDFQNAIHEATFQLDGLDQVLPIVAKDCAWPAKK